MTFAQFDKALVDEETKMKEMIITWADKVQWAKPGAEQGIVVSNLRLYPAALKVADVFLCVVTKGFSNMNVNESPTVTKSQLVEYHKELGDADAEQKAEELWGRLEGNPPGVEFGQFSEALKEL